jgi:hypothetical protein
MRVILGLRPVTCQVPVTVSLTTCRKTDHRTERVGTLNAPKRRTPSGLSILKGGPHERETSRGLSGSAR